MSEPCGESGFDRIFSERVWGGESRSGPGSDPRRTRHYRALLARSCLQPAIRRVVDLGCGDWSSSRLMDWSGIDYVGIDVVPDLVERLTSQYARPGVRFLHGDATRMPLPDADLAICKDV